MQLTTVTSLLTIHRSMRRSTQSKASAVLKSPLSGREPSVSLRPRAGGSDFVTFITFLKLELILSLLDNFKRPDSRWVSENGKVAGAGLTSRSTDTSLPQPTQTTSTF